MCSFDLPTIDQWIPWCTSDKGTPWSQLLPMVVRLLMVSSPHPLKQSQPVVLRTEGMAVTPRSRRLVEMANLAMGRSVGPLDRAASGFRTLPCGGSTKEGPFQAATWLDDHAGLVAINICPGTSACWWVIPYDWPMFCWPLWTHSMMNSMMNYLKPDLPLLLSIMHH